MRKRAFLFLSTSIVTSLCLGSPAAQAARWQPIGPEGGFVQALAFAPSDPRVVYAGTNGGVFRSSDGGSSWTATNNGLGPFYVFSLAVDPHNSALVYAGTGSGLYVTTSGGASWRLLPVEAKPSQALALVVKIDPAHPRILYAATGDGLFRSADGGAHWTERDSGLPTRFPFEVVALELDPDHPGTLYAGVFNNNGIDPFNPVPLVYKTIDGGGSWTVLAGLRVFNLSALAHLSSTSTLYVATNTGLFATQDGGASWALRSSLFFRGLAVNPSGALYGDTATGEVVRSVDGGKTWSPLAPSAPPVFVGDSNAFALDPRGDRVLAGSFRGIYAVDASAGWMQVNRGLRAAYVTGLAVSPASQSLLFAATLSEGIFVSGNGGKDFSARNAGIPPLGSTDISVASLAISPRAPRWVVAGSGVGDLVQTSDRGRHWTSETALCVSPDVLALDPPSTIFIATSSGLAGNSCPAPDPCTAKVSRDGGASFTCLDGPPAVSAFLVDPLQPAVVYAAGGNNIWKSTDSGGHFTQIASNLDMTVTSLAASPAAHQTLYAGGSQGVLKSTDGGVSWSPVNTGLLGGVTGLVVDPASASLVYALAFGGAYESRDGGASWSSLQDGFPSTQTTAIALDPVRHVLYVGTQGGAWALDLR